MITYVIITSETIPNVVLLFKFITFFLIFIIFFLIIYYYFLNIYMRVRLKRAVFANLVRFLTNVASSKIYVVEKKSIIFYRYNMRVYV